MSVSEYFINPTKRVRLVQRGHHTHPIKCNLFSSLYIWKSVAMTSATIAHSVRLVITGLFSKIAPGGSMSWVVGLPNNSYMPITNKAWVHARFCKLQKGCTRLAAASDQVYQLLARYRWFSLGARLLPPLKLVAMI